MNDRGKRADTSMRETGLPPALGYIRQHFLMTEMEMAAAQQNIVNFASANELDVAAIYVEMIETSPDALHRLIGDVMERTPKVVIVPGLHHLAVIGNPLTVRDQLQDNGIRVLVARHID